VADQLGRIHKDPALVAALVQAGHATVKARHDIRVLNARLEKMLKEVVDGQNG